MPKIGRNAPCPCGSGRKHKRCCLRRGLRLTGYTEEQRASALNKLFDFTGQPEWEQIYGQAWDVFYEPCGPAIELLDEEVVEEVSHETFLYWLHFDWRLPDGTRPVDRFLRAAPALAVGERAYLRQISSARMRLYEVVEIQPGRSVVLRDLLTRGEQRVRERLGSHGLQRWDIIAARVVALGASGGPEIDGALLLLARPLREGLTTMVREGLAALATTDGSVDASGYFETLPPVFHARSLQAQSAAQLPESVSGASGDGPSEDEEKAWSPATEEGASRPANEEASQAVLGRLERSTRAWLDEGSPALDGLSPRQAARIAGLRPGVVEQIKDLEHLYRSALRRGEPAYDPSWLWGELELGDHPDAPSRAGYPPPTGYESLERHLVGITATARTMAKRRRGRGDFGAATVLSQDEVADDPAFVRFVHAAGRAAFNDGNTRSTAAAHADLVGTHLHTVANFELHHRKTFWVDDALAWALGRTRLDIQGDQLRPPFASFALVFTDRHTLGLAERLLAADEVCDLRGRMLKSASVYVAQTLCGDARGLHLAFLFDAHQGQWPYLVSRDLLVEPDASLDDLLDSHFPDVDADALDPMFASPSLKQLIHLVLNAILYATSAGAEPELRRPPAGGRAPRQPAQAAEPLLSKQEVFFLPGKIDISQLRRIQKVERSPSGRTLMHRYMVRGHWRRANPSWKEQRPRWIEPYWRGPDMATLVEREYRLVQ